MVTDHMTTGANEVRAALLTARLYADAMAQPFLRPEGPGLMTIGQALDTLIASAGPDPPLTPDLTRWRIARALSIALNPTERDEKQDSPVLAAPETYTGEDNSALRDLMSASQRDERRTIGARSDMWRLIRDQVKALEASGGHETTRLAARSLAVDASTRRSQPLDWQTTVQIEPTGETKVASYIEVEGANFVRLAQLCDPSQWWKNSLFWYESSRLEDGRPLPHIDYDADVLPKSWDGYLLEVVSAIAIYHVVLKVSFKVRTDSCLVTYRLVSSSDQIVKDDGYAYVTKVGENRWRTQIVKRVDFANGPFGQPSAMDICLPSYIGSWLRVQQDLWAAEAGPIALGLRGGTIGVRRAE